MSRHKPILSGRWFCCVLYPDSDPSKENGYDFNEVHSILSTRFRFVRILHDKDIGVDGEIEKPHFHYVFRLPSSNPDKLISVYHVLGLPYTEVFKEKDGEEVLSDVKGTLQVCRVRRFAFRYLVHADHPNKAQYDVDDLDSNDVTLMNECINAIECESEDAKMQEVIYLLQSIECMVNYTDFMLALTSAGLWSTARRAGYGFIKSLIDEHNKDYR